MHIKADTKLIAALSLILAVAVSPISSAVFAEEEIDEAEIGEEKIDVEVKENKHFEKRELQQIREQFNEELKQLREQFKDNAEELREQIKQLRNEYKDKVRPHINDLRPHPDVRPHISDIRPHDGDRPDVDREPDLEFFTESPLDGWAILGGKSFDSEMEMRGVAAHTDNGVWKVKSTNVITVAERTVTLDMQGKARNGHIMLHGTGTPTDGEDAQHIRVQLRGYYVPVAGSDNEFAIAFTHAQIHNVNTGHRVPLALVGSVIVNPLGPEPVPLEPEVDIPEIVDQILS